MNEAKAKGKAVVVGGSIAGLSCAHALIAAGWEVVVLEKTCSPPTGCATGAGLGLDSLAQKIIQSWVKQPQILERTTLPLTIDQVNLRILQESELVKVIRETKDPFLNVIYDSEPLEQIVWGNMVLIGDAAHPTTPHGLKSTNMSILDAAVLGKCLQKWGVKNLTSALQEYQSIRLPVASEQVLFSRRLGQFKQGLTLPDRLPFDPFIASREDCEELEQEGNSKEIQIRYWITSHLQSPILW